MIDFVWLFQWEYEMCIISRQRQARSTRQKEMVVHLLQVGLTKIERRTIWFSLLLTPTFLLLWLRTYRTRCICLAYVWFKLKSELSRCIASTFVVGNPSKSCTSCKREIRRIQTGLGSLEPWYSDFITLSDSINAQDRSDMVWQPLRPSSPKSKV